MESPEFKPQRPPHFVLIPWMAQGHFIPMLDIARLLAARTAPVTVVTTPGNAARVETTIARLVASGLAVAFVTLPFPSAEAGLPDGCENLDAVPTRALTRNFYCAAKLLREPLERLLRSLGPPPSCIVTGVGFPWLHGVARELGVPRLVFHGFSCFSILASHNLYQFKTHEAAASPSEAFVLPGLPHAIEITKAHLPKFFDNASKFQDIYQELRDGEVTADGMVINSFEELEPGYAESLAKATGKKVWAIGPVSLSTKEKLDVAERGNKASVNEQKCLQWLDSQKPGSVIYVCFGSMGRVAPAQLIELGSGLEASNHPFVWVIRGGEESLEMEQWFEERTKERGLVIRGWAPQVMILSHPAVGGFVTHCGWNSTLEGVSAGLPMITWPLGADQFLNEKLVVEVLGIGVSVGATATLQDGDGGVEGEVVTREEVAGAVQRLMDEGEEGKKRRRKARQLGEMAGRAMEEGGSSNSSLAILILDASSSASKKTVVNKC